MAAMGCRSFFSGSLVIRTSSPPLNDEDRRTFGPTASSPLVACWEGRAYIDVETIAFRLLTHKFMTGMAAMVLVATWN